MGALYEIHKRCMDIKESGGKVISVDYILSELQKDAQTGLEADMSDSGSEVGRIHVQ